MVKEKEVTNNEKTQTLEDLKESTPEVLVEELTKPTEEDNNA